MRYTKTWNEAKALLKRFWTEEDGLGTVEIIILIAVLVGVALIFKDGIATFVRQLMDKIFQVPDTSMPPAGDGP